MESNNQAGIKRTGRIYFTKKTERRFFFFMTLAMLGVGLVARLV